MSKRDGATGAPIKDSFQGLNIDTQATSRPFDVSPRAHAGLDVAPALQGFPVGVFNDPGFSVRQVLCVKGAHNLTPSDEETVSILALLARTDGQIRIFHEACKSDTGEVHEVKAGQRFFPVGNFGPSRIRRVWATGTTAELVALPCGAVGSYGRRATDRSLAQTERALRAEGKMKCPVCGGEELVPFAPPLEEVPDAPVLWQPPTFT